MHRYFICHYIGIRLREKKMLHFMHETFLFILKHSCFDKYGNRLCHLWFFVISDYRVQIIIMLMCVQISFLSKGIILWIELPWSENLLNTYTRHTEGLASCFDLIRSHQQCIPWSPPLDNEPATTDCRAENLQLSQMMPN